MERDNVEFFRQAGFVVKFIKGLFIKVQVFKRCILGQFVRTQNVDWVEEPAKGAYDAVILCVAHDQFRALTEDELRALGRGTSVLYDVKSVLPLDVVDGRL